MNYQTWNKTFTARLVNPMTGAGKNAIRQRGPFHIDLWSGFLTFGITNLI